MSDLPLTSLVSYSHFVAEALDRATIERSTVAVWSTSPYAGVAEGEVFFLQGFRLRLREELDFEAGLITAYGYEVYQGEEKLYWYDDFPHPNDRTLAATYPHHKHVPPDIKHIFICFQWTVSHLPASNFEVAPIQLRYWG